MIDALSLFFFIAGLAALGWSVFFTEAPSPYIDHEYSWGDRHRGLLLGIWIACMLLSGIFQLMSD